MARVMFIMAEGAMFNTNDFKKTPDVSLEDRYDAIMALIEAKLPLDISKDTRIKYREDYVEELSTRLLRGKELPIHLMLAWDYASTLKNKSPRSNLEKEPKYRVNAQLDEMEKQLRARKTPPRTKAGRAFKSNCGLTQGDVNKAFNPPKEEAPKLVAGIGKFLYEYSKEDSDIKVVLLTEGSPQRIKQWLELRSFTDEIMPPIENVPYDDKGTLNKMALETLVEKYQIEQCSNEIPLFIAARYKGQYTCAKQLGLKPVLLSSEDTPRAMVEISEQLEALEEQGQEVEYPFHIEDWSKMSNVIKKHQQQQLKLNM